MEENWFVKVFNAIREKLPILGARTAAFVGFLVICSTIFVHYAHSLGILSMFKIPDEIVMASLLSCSIVLSLGILEQFSRTEFGVQSLKEKVSDHLNETEGTVVSLQNEVAKSLNNVTHSLNELRNHQMSSIEIASFRCSDQFQPHWHHILDVYKSLILWGNFGASFTTEFRKIQESGKPCSYYIPIEENCQNVAETFLGLADDAPHDALKLYESGSLGGPSWIIGTDLRYQKAEVLLCFGHLTEERSPCFHLTGPAAWDFHQCVASRLETGSAPNQSSVPIRIYSRRQIETVVSLKLSFKNQLLGVDKGRVLKGVEDICDAMIHQLSECTESVHLVHICSRETIPLFQSKEFTAWFRANYAAAKDADKKIKIIRIFIRPKSLRSDPVLLTTIAEMRANDIHVLVYDKEALPEDLLEDFSIYDRCHVIYIERVGGLWLSEDTTQARRSDSKEQVQKYSRIFELIKGRAEQNAWR